MQRSVAADELASDTFTPRSIANVSGPNFRLLREQKGNLDYAVTASETGGSAWRKWWRLAFGARMGDASAATRWASIHVRDCTLTYRSRNSFDRRGVRWWQDRAAVKDRGRRVATFPTSSRRLRVLHALVCRLIIAIKVASHSLDGDVGAAAQGGQ